MDASKFTMSNQMKILFLNKKTALKGGLKNKNVVTGLKLP